jgi:3-dehydroquinate synthase II
MREIWLQTEGIDWNDVKLQITDAIELGFTGVISNHDHDKIRKLGKIEVLSRNSDNVAFIEIKSSKDQDDAVRLSQDKDYLFLSFTDWKVIPLENLIAMKGNSKLIVEVNSPEEARLVLETLEKGADGILVKYMSREYLGEFARIVESHERVELVEAEITELRQLGMGDRVCIDTVTMMNPGEGMLVGNLSMFMFLVASESEESEYVASRPFRVNAGSVNAYLRNGRDTKYLAELKAGDEVEILRYDGNVRKSYVGRVKIEKRPMILVRARVAGFSGSVILQNAETIKLIRKDGSHISVTSLNEGDRVLVWVEKSGKGRHFGKEIEEFIIER